MSARICWSSTTTRSSARLITTTLEDVPQFELLEAERRRRGAGAGRRAAARDRASSTSTCPGWTGSRPAGALRADPATGEATIVMLTAAHGDGIEAAAEEAGADLFLTKPFSPLELLRLVDRLGGDGRD